MKSILKYSLIILAVAVMATSCAKKLDLFPQNDLTPEKTFATPAGYKAVLAKIYGTLSITGNRGPAGNDEYPPDIGGGLDEGSQVAFIRGFFNCQELPTDEAIVAWNDQTIHDFHDLRWTAADPFLKGMYARPIYNVTLINEYLRESTDEKLESRGIKDGDATEIRKTRAEARFLRAFNYWVMLDIFGKSTFITEDDQVGTAIPGEIERPQLFEYIEAELKDIEDDLATVRTAEYGRVDQGAAWALLARMYLNAKVYTGTAKYTEAIAYAKKVIDAGYTLHDNYGELFMADNDKHKNEFMFVINCDGRRTQAYGNTTFLMHAPSGDDHDYYGTGSGWNGYRATKGLADQFVDLAGNSVLDGNIDTRALFTTTHYSPTTGQITINDPSNFANGMHVAKWRNVRSDGAPVSDATRDFADIDFPVFRLPEMYLIYAEAVLRGGTGGDVATAVNYINAIRERAYGNDDGNITAGQLNLDFILAERARELYWEGHRRTDLIRYDLLTTGTYLWPWKGGVSSGTAVNSRYNIFPIPSENRTANPNLSQNLDY